jgi:hypothetical protein
VFVPFYIYQVDKTQYQQIRTIPLAGKNGPLAKLAIQSFNEQKPISSGKWHIDEKQIISEIVTDRTKEYAIIIDLKPDDTKTVSLFRLKEIWGSSDEEWTPIMLKLETLFIGEKIKAPMDFKKLFEVDKKTRLDYAYEFLYLQGGSKSGTWNWGRTGGVNGALLWEDTWKYFQGNIKY